VSDGVDIAEVFTDPNSLGNDFSGASWVSWLAILKAAFAIKMSRRERRVFEQLSGDREPPKERVKQLWVIAGRRSGKTSVAAGITIFLSAFTDYRPFLRRGERALVALLAVNRAQAATALGYVRDMLNGVPLLRNLIENETAELISLATGCDITVQTNSFRGVRGRTLAGAVFDEASFWRSELTAIPDIETYRAVMPSMVTLPNSMLIGIGSAYRRSGLMYQKFKEHFGKPGSTLVIKAETRQLNENIDADLIAEELKADPSAAASEWLSQFRQDIETYVDMETLERCVVPGRVELPPMQQNYLGFVDPSGGSGADAFAIAIAHVDTETGRAVLDVLRARKPKFSPADVIEEFSGLLKRYHVHKVLGDAFSGEFVVERFAECGITYERSEATKSVLYANFLGPLNSGQVELLDQPELLAELAGLERRVSRGAGRENIDHGPAGHDDRANVCAGCMVNVLSSAQGANEWIRVGRAVLGIGPTTPLDPPASPPVPAGALERVHPAPGTAAYNARERSRGMPGLSAVTMPGEATVAALVPKDFNLSTEDRNGEIIVIAIPAGTCVLPERLLDHWWLRAAGVHLAGARPATELGSESGTDLAVDAEAAS
jgi:hypothetical protein